MKKTFRNSSSIKSFLLFVMMMAFPIIIAAQGDLGSIAGTVKDANSDVIVGASVTATNLATGTQRTTTTNDSGNFTIPNLNVGEYSVVTTVAGFNEKKIESVKVSVAFTNQINLVVTPVGVTGIVQVTTSNETISVNTNDQQLSTLIDNKKILDLPLLSRDPNSLVLLAPGTIPSTSSLGGVSINGQRERNNNFLVDGVDNNDTDVPGILGGVSTPNIDATEEFRVITNNFLPEFGRNSGGIITVATRRGTNEFHGGAYLFFRDGKTDARNFFDRTGSPAPLQRKQYGATIGGPIYFPRFGEGGSPVYSGKNRSFFFFNVEKDFFKSANTVTRSVPSASARQGILNLTALGLGTIDLRAGSPNNRLGIPINPALQSLLNIYPLGNSPGEGSLPGVFDFYRFQSASVNESTQYAARVDHRFNDKNSISASLNYSKGTFEFCCETFPGFDDNIKSPQKGLVLSTSFSTSITSRLFNEFRFGINRLDASFTGNGDAGVNPASAIAARQAINAAGSRVNDNSTDNGSFIGFGISGLSSPSQFFDTQGRLSGTTTFNDSLTWIKGNHQYKFGHETRMVFSNGATNFGRQESLSFSVPTTFGFPLVRSNTGALLSLSGLNGTVQNFASYLYGFVAQQSQSQYFDLQGKRRTSDDRRFRTNEFNFFFQDTWKIRPNFSFNYGVRYEINTVPYEKDGLLSTLAKQDPSSVTPAGGFEFTTLERGQLLYKNDFNNFAPRVGFAYSPDFKGGFFKTLFGATGQSSIRGGYGIFYDRIFGNLFSNARGNPPFQQDFASFPGDTIENISRPPVLTPSRFVQNGDQIFPVIFALPGNNPYQSKFSIPYTQSYNLGFQRQFARKFLLELNYVGSRGSNLLRVFDGQLVSVDRANALLGRNNAINPNSGFRNYQNGALNQAFFNVATNATVGNSYYDSGQLRVTYRLDSKTYGNGQFQAFYTLSHSIDDAADPLVGQSGERTFPRDSSGYVGGFRAEKGNSGFDRRHSFVANSVYELPFKSSNAFVNQLVSGFTLSGIFRVYSGSAFSVFGSTDSAGTGFGQRADYANTGNGLTATTGLDPRTQTGPTRDQFANPLPNANGTGRQGSSGKNAFHGPGFSVLDMSLIKRFKFGREGRYIFSVRADAFNLLNTVNFSNPVNSINSLNFGQSTSAGSPRRFQFAGRLNF